MEKSNKSGALRANAESKQAAAYVKKRRKNMLPCTERCFVCMKLLGEIGSVLKKKECDGTREKN